MMGNSWRKYEEHFEPNCATLGQDKFTLQLLKELNFTPQDVDSFYTG